MKKIVLTIVTIVLALILLVPACLVGLGVTPYQLGFVQTGSMSPALPSETAVLIKKHDPILGEPIVFRQHNEVIVHRWIGMNADGTLKTKGDANTSADTWNLNKADVIGGVVWSMPKLGYWIKYFQSPLLLGVLPFVAMCCFMLLCPISSEPSDQDDATENISLQAV